MESVKNNFEELKKMLSGALSILEETNVGIVDRMVYLEKRVSELESRLEKLENMVLVPVAVETEAAGQVDEADEVEQIYQVDEVQQIDQVDEVQQIDEVDKVDQVDDMAVEQVMDVKGDDVVVDSELEEKLDGNIGEEIDGSIGENIEEEIEEEIEERIAENIGEAVDEIAEVVVGEQKMVNDISVTEIQQIVNEAAKPDWYDWEVDYPAAYVDDVYSAISFNDRYEFIKELFNVTGNLDDAQMLFKETLDVINEMDNFKKVVAYIRDKFPQWDEQSDEVYRFYMSVRRKFNK